MDFSRALGAFSRAVGVSAILAAGASALFAPGCNQDAPPTHLKGQVHVTLLHTADIHSRLFPYNLQIGQVDAGLGLGSAGTISDVGGVGRMSHIIGRERARSGRVLHLDGGDCFQGAPVFNFFQGEAELRALSAMGTDAMVVANHEFDTGARNLATQLQKWAAFPVLAANYQLEDPELPGASPLGTIFKPYEVFDLEGLRVGVIGMGNLSTLTSIFDSPNKFGITPLQTRETVQSYVDILRPDVDLVVVVTHLGLDVDERMIEETTGVDVVLGGHNHIVLQPPKHVQDCSAHFDKAAQSYYVEVDGPKPKETIKRYCKPRDVILAHSGAFAKYVGRLDLLISNDPKDLPEGYDKLNGFEVLSNDYHLFPVNAEVPSDPIVDSLLEPYAQGLDSFASLDLLVGYAPDGSKRSSPTGGDSQLGNLIADAMWLRLGVQTDFSLTNTTGIRADLVPGPVTIEQMYNIFPFDNSITKMQVSGDELQQLFDFVARRSAGRGCVSQIQIAGARLVLNCGIQGDPGFGPGKATGIFIGASVDAKGKLLKCTTDDDCPGKKFGSCDTDSGICWQPIDRSAVYDLATSNYLAGGGSGFRVLQRNTTQLDTRVQQRDALIDYLRAGGPCGAGSTKKLRSCSDDSDCLEKDGADPDLVGSAGTYVCACPDSVLENDTCDSSGKSCKGKGQCVLAACRADVAAFQRQTCDNAPTAKIKASCEKSLSACAAAGEQCKFLACVDKRAGNTTDGRLNMVGLGTGGPNP
jgi:5'-nucleotidase